MSQASNQLRAFLAALLWSFQASIAPAATAPPQAATAPPQAATAPPPAPPLRITVTVPPLAWLVSEVAGPNVTVEHLIDAGESPETFQPTDLEITSVARSAIFFRVGVSVEKSPWLRSLERSGRIRVVDLREGVTLREMKACRQHGESPPNHPQEAHHHLEEARRDLEALDLGMDPHIWLSPRRLVIMTKTIARHLTGVDPHRAKQFTERAAELTTRLHVLDTELKNLLAPVRGGTFFVFHPAWGYFADDYGLHQVAIESEGKEPTEKELAHLVREARRLGVRTIFVQPQLQSTTLETVAGIVGARVETLDPLAADPPANLRRVAKRLLAALHPTEEARS